MLTIFAVKTPIRNKLLCWWKIQLTKKSPPYEGGDKGEVELMERNPKYTKKLRRHLRNNMTKTEIMLWNRLKGKRILGYKVRRQYGIGPYVVDFYCPRLKLALEVDGESHFTIVGRQHDRKRDDYIQNQGIKVLRVTTTEIYDNLEGIVAYLSQEFQNRQDYW